jgi:hypothetical protein
LDTIVPSEHTVLDFTVEVPDNNMARALADDAATIATEINRVVVTNPQTIQLSILGLLAEGHILLEVERLTKSGADVSFRDYLGRLPSEMPESDESE